MRSGAGIAQGKKIFAGNAVSVVAHLITILGVVLAVALPPSRAIE